MSRNGRKDNKKTNRHAFENTEKIRKNLHFVVAEMQVLCYTIFSRKYNYKEERCSCIWIMLLIYLM